MPTVDERNPLPSAPIKLMDPAGGCRIQDLPTATLQGALQLQPWFDGGFYSMDSMLTKSFVGRETGLCCVSCKLGDHSKIAFQAEQGFSWLHPSNASLRT